MTREEHITEDGRTAEQAPEKPTLAPGVRLVGELRETGFEDRQWLVERDGKFVQLTELLYRVAERADGERTPEEIAAGMTDTTEWTVGSDDVRFLIEEKLVPMGLISPAEGSEAPSGGQRTSSPLQLTARIRVIGLRAIEPFTRVLQFLFLPFVIVPVLGAVVAAHVWLYAFHGIGDAFREALYQPGALLVVLAAMLAAGVFHEFGHAAALRYGGGRVRGMGAGFYLIYPVLYTDVTDSYRLARRARVRVDLGGFYFHLILALGIMGAYLISGREFLLFIVLLTSIDIVRQCLPFVRFDGYWTLADLTGIPDFFSQMGAFLRSVLPLPRWKGARLPRLKPWVRVVFAAYVATAVPVLALLLYFLVTRLPFIVSTIWGAFLSQTEVFSRALDDGEFLTGAASASQALILGLQMAAVAFLLYKIGTSLVLSLWRRVARYRRATS